MVVILYIFAALEFIGGIGVFAGSKGNEILGTLLVGFSIMTAGLAGILAEVASSRKLLERQVEWSRKLLETQVLRSEKLLEEQRLNAAAQVDASATTYRGKKKKPHGPLSSHFRPKPLGKIGFPRLLGPRTCVFLGWS
jgi:hypothetical protein